MNLKNIKVQFDSRLSIHLTGRISYTWTSN